MNVLYIVPDLNKVSGGPRTRITMFKHTFKEKNGIVIEKGNKLLKSIIPQKINLVYVESATNRISLIDVLCLFALRLYAKNITVFIRDIYIELFPQEYNTFRGKITLVVNKLSNFFLTLISSTMVFPTDEMGIVFFEKNKLFPKRKFYSLPPGTLISKNIRSLPNFDKKLGILYLGSTRYANSGFENFIKLSIQYSKYYNFFVLSGDENLKEKLINTTIYLNSVNHSEIPKFIETNNIAFAIHTRPRNQYDDLTFPIKILDFISLKLPFFSEKHLPLVELLGNDYELFLNLENFEKINAIIQNTSKEKYSQWVTFLKNLAFANTYEERYKKLLSK